MVADYYSALFRGHYNQAITYLHVTTAPNPAMNVTTAGELETQDRQWAAGASPARTYRIKSQSVNGSTASVVVAIFRGASPSGTVDLQLSSSGGTWQINFADNPGLLY